MHIVFIGAGNVARALAENAQTAGHTVAFAVQDAESASARAAAAAAPNAPLLPIPGCAAGADVVVLAVPNGAAAEVLDDVGPFGGAILVDATNAFGGVAAPYATMAEVVAAHADDARVVKGFNVVGAESMAHPLMPDGSRVFLPVAGDDPDAVATVVQMAQSMGFDAVAAGGLGAAVLLEDLARLWGAVAMGAGLGRGVAFTLARGDRA